MSGKRKREDDSKMAPSDEKSAVDASKTDAGKPVADAGKTDAGKPVADAGKTDAGKPVVDASKPVSSGGSGNGTKESAYAKASHDKWVEVLRTLGYTIECPVRGTDAQWIEAGKYLALLAKYPVGRLPVDPDMYLEGLGPVLQSWMDPAFKTAVKTILLKFVEYACGASYWREQLH